ncbi:MAG: septation protein SepH [Arachnia sp.]
MRVPLIGWAPAIFQVEVRMNSALSPREIQARLRAGASIPEVAAEAGVDVDRISGFAIPVMAERAHMTRTALASTVRRRGDGSGHRRLGELIRERLQARGLDSDVVEWDSWRQNDLKWRLVGLLDEQAASRAAEFIFDPKGLFSVADNADSRWMIGEEPPGSQGDPDNENTIDFHDELALVRATSDDPSFITSGTGTPGDDVPPMESPYEASSHTSELDYLYDMLSGVSEDSVRIYLGLEDDANSDSPDEDTRAGEEVAVDVAGETRVAAASGNADAPGTTISADVSDDGASDEALADAPSEHPDLEQGTLTGPSTADTPGPGHDAPAPTPSPDQDPARDVRSSAATPDPKPSSGTPEQDALVPETAPATPKRKPARKRASIPSWDEIMFGGPTKS